MNLDDLQSFQSDAQRKALDEISSLPVSLLDGFVAGRKPAPENLEGIRQIVLSGTGESASGADLLAGYAASLCSLPISVHRDYGAPAFANGPGTLFIAVSHSGETEETLDGFTAAVNAGCRVLVLTTGGTLAEEAAKAGAPVWQIRPSPGYSFGLLLALFERLGFVPDQDALLRATVATLQTEQDTLRPETPVSQNLAKRDAGQLMGRLVTIFAAGQLVPVARRWKTRINTVAKSIAQFEPLPEADYGALHGTNMPEPILLHSMALFLRAPSDQRQNRLRSNMTRRALMLEGVNTDVVDARGDSPLAHLWTLAQLGDYIAFYLSAAYGVDPTPPQARENPKSLK